jgi:hypothetical protein
MEERRDVVEMDIPAISEQDSGGDTHASPHAAAEGKRRKHRNRMKVGSSDDVGISQELDACKRVGLVYFISSS